MNWLELSFHTTHEAFDLVSNIFIEAGSKGVLLEDSNTLTEAHEDHFGEIYRLNPDDYPKTGVVIKGYLAVTTDIENAIPTEFDLGLNTNLNTFNGESPNLSKDILIDSFKEALSGMTFKAFDETFGELVVDNVEKVVYS